METPVQRNDGLPTIAVLPFAAADGDAWLALGLHEDICSELTRFRGIRVIAPASAGVVVDHADGEIAKALGATHVLRGRLRRQAEALQLSVALADARAAVQLWAERVTLAGADVQGLESLLVGRIAATLNARLEEAANAAAQRRGASGLAAYELTVRGLKLMRDGTLEADEAARACFEEAIRLDPHFARAHSGIALSWFNEWSCQFWDRFEEASRKAYVHAHRALQLDDTDAMVHLVLAKVALFRQSYEQAAWYLDRALSLCPHDADLLVQAAILEVYLGRPDAAVEHAELALRLNPHHPAFYHVVAAFAHVFAGRLETAIACGARSDAIPFVDAPAYLAFAHAHLGNLDAARAEYGRYLDAYREKIAFGQPFEPDAPREWLFRNNPFRRDEDMDFLRRGFDRLGVAGRRSTEPPVPLPGPNLLSRDGDGWIAVYGGRRATLPDLKGLRDIRQLLGHPGEEIHCLDLAGRELMGAGDAVLDERARAALKRRLGDLQEEIEDAEDANDSGRAERARAERERLVEALAAALGLGGRNRRLGDQAEKARTSVTWRIRHALRRIEASHPALGRHLCNSIRTGTFCRYSPEAPVAWTLPADAPGR
ncbi:hypothetical protein [Chthonobacter rhizosphaerae]|uniref:hypothetical protein n=1 Tax=Chthonobacter rhizosphaerae TaxID=2735553 RepID=UPI0015EEE9AB|nr:hypothetical protein [Chthonobacter rhizosphaerae]